MPTIRIKKPLLTLTTRAEVERIVGELRALKIEEQKILAVQNEAVRAIEEKFAPALELNAAQFDQRRTAVQAWAESHPEEFEKRKSIEFTHGLVGFRVGMHKVALLSRAWTWDKCLAMLESLAPAFVRRTPEVDKEQLIAQRDDATVQHLLRGCGMKIVQEEKFFVEPVLTEVEKRETSEVIA